MPNTEPGHGPARDFTGYGPHSIDPEWPGEARIAVQFVINYEEGAERNILDGDDASEHRLTDIPGAQPRSGQRTMNVESQFEYGSRAGIWRLRRLFDRYRIPVTLFGVATALERNPPVVAAAIESGWEIACHGLRWIPYYDVDQRTEREHIRSAIELHTRLTGSPPAGWYTGAASPNTIRLVAEHADIVYSSDAYADDLPYWCDAGPRPLLIIPYAYDTNDLRFATSPGFSTADHFTQYLINAFNMLYHEGRTGAPKLMTVALHSRLSGRPGRVGAIQQFLDHLQSLTQVWTPTRIALADHWSNVHPPASTLRSLARVFPQ